MTEQGKDVLILTMVASERKENVHSQRRVGESHNENAIENEEKLWRSTNNVIT